MSEIRNLIVVSDTHCGCRMGLCPETVSPLDDGGFYRPSPFQEQLWAYWREFWDEWVPMTTRGEPYDIAHNGDAIDGVHHGSTTQISHNIQDQVRIAEQVMRPEIDRAKSMGGKYYHIRGTEAHVGQSAVNEENLAERLGATPNSSGQYARYDLWKRVGKALTHLMHHVGTTSSSAHEASAVNAEITAEFVEAARWGEQPPDFVVRSHRHRFIAVDIDTARGYGASVVTPGWQGKTPFGWKIAGARITQPQFGGVIIRSGDEEFFYRRKVWSIARSLEE